MPWKRLPNDLRAKITDWPAADNDAKVRHNCSLAQARRFALKDPKINCFFICREPNSKKYKQNDAVFFTLDDNIVSSLIGHQNSVRGQDLYVKAGMSVAFFNPGDTSTTSLASACRYTTRDGDAAVDVVCIFAANLVLEVSGGYTALADSFVESAKKRKGTIAVANGDILRVLKEEKDTIQDLKQKGITVLLSFLNHHQDTGWSEFGPEEKDDASQFAKQLKAVMEKYGLDGVDIDDEYSLNQDVRRRHRTAKDKSVANSLAMLSAKLGYEFKKENLIVTKSLFEDESFFGRVYDGKHEKTYKLEDILTYGWEMSYWEVSSISLVRYVEKNMAKRKLLKGFKIPENSQVEDYVKSQVGDDIKWLKTTGYAGFMVFDFQRQAGQDLMGKLVERWLGDGNWNY